MSNATKSMERALNHELRLDWLRAHPTLLARLPGAMNDLDARQAEALDEALRGMSLIRLYAPTSAADKSRWGIRLLVSELRGEPVDSKDQRYRS